MGTEPGLPAGPRQFPCLKGVSDPFAKVLQGESHPLSAQRLLRALPHLQSLSHVAENGPA